MAFTFKGGIHPNDMKGLTESKPVEYITPPEKLYIPLLQNIGAPCEPLVKVNDYVYMGQKIGESNHPVSTPVHASVSGKVVGIDSYYHPSGIKQQAVIIENDFKDNLDEKIVPSEKPYYEYQPEEIIEKIRECGLVGMGGAGFPTYFKINSMLGKIDTLIINGAECEPYLTSDYRLMIENPLEIVKGIKILLHVFSLNKAIIAIESNKLQAIRSLRQTVGDDKSIEVAILETKYPQGGEKQIIRAITGRKVPPGKLPSEVGCAVFNVESCASISRAINNGMPVIQRIVTVSGSSVAVPKNLMVRLGTPIRYLIDKCDGFATDPKKIIMGGPMMGIAQHSLDVPVIKTSSGVLCFTAGGEKHSDNPVCIRCGKCIRVCPMNLSPTMLYLYGQNGELDECTRLNISDCMECGSCAYVCPGRLPLVQSISTTKMKLAIKDRRNKKKDGK